MPSKSVWLRRGGPSVRRDAQSQCCCSSVAVIVVLSLVINAAATAAAAARADTTAAPTGIKCGPKVARTFAQLVDPTVYVPEEPIPDAMLDVCSHTLPYTGGDSCCTASMETVMLEAAPEYFHSRIKLCNQKLKTGISRSGRLFEEHLRESMSESQEQISARLTQTFGIPASELSPALGTLMQSLERFYHGADEPPAEDIVRNLFVQLFPLVFEYVLRDRQESTSTGDDFDACVMSVYDEVAPFGDVPRYLASRLKFSFLRARLFAQTLQVLTTAIELTERTPGIEKTCLKAISHLHFCSMCAGKPEVRLCHGLCLNVMRGCLSGVSEMSSAWDQLVTTFENMERGMFLHYHNAQEQMVQLNNNITQAVANAMAEGGSLYNDVMSRCRNSDKASSSFSPKSSSLLGEQLAALEDKLQHDSVPPLAHVTRHKSLRNDVNSLVDLLEENKGFMLKLPDNLCHDSLVYEQKMDSAECWNGSAVGKYTRETIEMNLISQAKHNKEVRVTLFPDAEVVKVKDMLTHMRRNLSTLLNEEIMLSDESIYAYAREEHAFSGSGSGDFVSGTASNSREVVVDTDDEDLNWSLSESDMISGSGSGEGHSHWLEGGDKHTPTSGPGGRRKGGVNNKGKTPTAQPDKGDDPHRGRGGGDAASTLSVSLTLLLVMTFLSWQSGVSERR